MYYTACTFRIGGGLVRWLCVEAEVSLIGVPVDIWVVVKIRVLFWVPIIIRHRLFRDPKRDPNFDNYPYTYNFLT